MGGQFQLSGDLAKVSHAGAAGDVSAATARKLSVPARTSADRPRSTSHQPSAPPRTARSRLMNARPHQCRGRFASLVPPARGPILRASARTGFSPITESARGRC